MQSSELGTAPISKLIIEQAVPAAVGFMVMSVNMIVDTIFVGHWVGALGIAAITVVLPITFLIAAVGMSIGVGGASIISRALGAGDLNFANRVFGNQITLNTIVASIAIIAVAYFSKDLLLLFGAKGEIMPYAKAYFEIVLLGIPFLAWAMMSNHTIRSQGFPGTAMNVMLLPALLNLVLDPIFIYTLDWGLEGAAWATIISYFSSATYAVWFFVKGKSDLRIKLSNLRLEKKIVVEISKLGIVSFARQGMVSLLAIALNNSLFFYGNELYVSVYGIINRVMMFSLFPITGISQGFMPITSYNYGAGNKERVKEVIRKSIFYGTAIAIGIMGLIVFFRYEIVYLFSPEPQLLEVTPQAMVVVFLATPVILVQLIGASYFQAIGKAGPALLLTLTKQGFFLIPLIYILPQYWGINGIWYSFPIADITSSLVTFYFLRKAYNKL